MTTEHCVRCGATLEQSLRCGYCYALANGAKVLELEQEFPDHTEAEWQEICNPNEGSK